MSPAASGWARGLGLRAQPDTEAWLLVEVPPAQPAARTPHSPGELPPPALVARAAAVAFGRAPDAVRGPLWATGVELGTHGSLSSGARPAVQFPWPASLLDRGDASLAVAQPWLAPPGLATDLAGCTGLSILFGAGRPAPAGALSRDELEHLLRYGAPPPSVSRGTASEDGLLAGDDLAVSPTRASVSPRAVARGRGPASETRVLACRVTFDRGVPPLVRPRVRIGRGSRVGRAAVAFDVEGLPPVPERFPGGRLAIYLMTPGIFDRGWCPSLPDPTARIVAACNPEIATAPAGARGLYRSRAVTAGPAVGSVFYVQCSSEDAAQALARALHGECLRQAEPHLSAAGYGWCVCGVWTDAATG